MNNPITTTLNVDDYLRMALKEDITSEDITTNAIMKEYKSGSADLICKQDGILAGIHIFSRVFTLLDDILQKRAQPDDIRALGYKYYIPDTDTHTCKALISLQGRFSYLQFIPQLDYAFGLLDE